jgi:hypothetical protein
MCCYRHWWQYLIATLIVLFGVLFFANGTLETLTIDKELELVTIHKKKCWYCIRKQSYDLKNVRNIRSFKKGHEGINHYTLHYTLQVEFYKDQMPVKVWESMNHDTIQEKVSFKRSNNSFIV